jgi:hypothetical protein
VVPAECIVYLRPLARRSFWTSVTSAETEAEAVPTCYSVSMLFAWNVLVTRGYTGTMQKSA